MEDGHTRSRPSTRRILLALGVVVAACALFGGIAWLTLVVYAPAPPGTSALEHELRDRGRVAVVGDPDLLRLEAEGAQLIAAEDVRGLERALDGAGEDALDAILRREGIAGIVVDGRGARADRPRRLRDRLRAYDHFEVLEGAYLTPVAALYLRRRGVRLTEEEGALLARAARQILGGSSLPRVRSFPEPLRRTRNVEVLVMLRQGGQPRLWRSARDGSVARALITAATVARDRWAEREAAMGGPIERRLGSMRVEVYLLEEDGTIDTRSPAFIERVVSPEHGVALEARGAWHYLLPEATRERGGGSAMRAYAALLEDAGLPADALTTRQLRLYRLVARPVGTSAPSARSLSPDAPGSLGELFDVPGLD